MNGKYKIFLFNFMIWQLATINTMLITSMNYQNLTTVAFSSANQQNAVYIASFSNNKASVIKYQITALGMNAIKQYNNNQQTSQYSHIYETNNYLICTAIDLRSTTDIYNKNTLELITIWPTQYQIFRAISVKSTNQLIFSTNEGLIGMTWCNNLQGVTVSSLNLQESKHIGNIYLSVSPDESLFAASDLNTNLMSIWSTSSLTQTLNLHLPEAGIRSHCWSSDSLMLFVISYELGTIYALNRANNFSIIDIIPTNRKKIFSSFYSESTNELVLSTSDINSTQQVFTVSLSTNNETLFLEMPFLQEVISNEPTSLLVAYNSSFVEIYEIHSECAGGQYYNGINQTCVDCTGNCLICNRYKCFLCPQGATLNILTKTCDYPIIAVTPASKIDPRMSLFYQSTFTVLNATLKIPGHRQVLSPFFTLFSNFDHLVLYIYHNRTYGPQMTEVLSLVHSTIDYRFQIINNNICKDILGLDFNKWQNYIDYRQNYSLPSFVALEKNGEGFIVTNLQYFFLNIPMILGIYLIELALFKLLFNHEISLLFRKFSFYGILLLLLTQGNIQFFTFSFVAEILMGMKRNFFHKALQVANIFCFFALISMVTAGFLFFHILYKKKSKYLYQNCHGRLHSGFYFMIVIGLSDMARGFIHRLLIESPNSQAIVMLLLELANVILMMVFLFKYRIFQSSLQIMLLSLSTSSRVVLNISFLINANNQNALLADNIQYYIFFFNVGTFFIAALKQIYEVVDTIASYLTKKYQHYRQQKVKQTQIQPQIANPKIEITFGNQEIKKIILPTTMKMFSSKVAPIQTSPPNKTAKIIMKHRGNLDAFIKKKPIKQLRFQ